jgi:hypothetical protein
MGYKIAEHCPIHDGSQLSEVGTFVEQVEERLLGKDSLNVEILEEEMKRLIKIVLSHEFNHNQWLDIARYVNVESADIRQVIDTQEKYSRRKVKELFEVVDRMLLLQTMVCYEKWVKSKLDLVEKEAYKRGYERAMHDAFEVTGEG